jgi:hypothetical protein
MRLATVCVGMAALCALLLLLALPLPTNLSASRGPALPLPTSLPASRGPAHTMHVLEPDGPEMYTGAGSVHAEAVPAARAFAPVSWHDAEAFPAARAFVPASCLVGFLLLVAKKRSKVSAVHTRTEN